MVFWPTGRRTPAAVRLSIAIRFADDKEAPNNRGNVLPVFWAAWKWTGDTKYLQPFQDQGPRALETIPSNALDQLEVRQTWGNEIVAMMKGGPNSQRRLARSEYAKSKQPTPQRSAAEQLCADAFCLADDGRQAVA